MFYPGQAVYIPSEKRLGIYIGYVLETKWPYSPVCYVYQYMGENGVESDTNVWGTADIMPISKPDKKSLTGQTTYRTPFQRTTFARIFYENELDKVQVDLLNEMAKLQKTKWFKEKYEVNLVVED